VPTSSCSGMAPVHNLEAPRVRIVWCDISSHLRDSWRFVSLTYLEVVRARNLFLDDTSF
jgi:hypothetical protein